MELHTFSYKEYLKEFFPDTALIVHSILLVLIAIIFIPLLILSDQVQPYNRAFWIFLTIYGSFVILITLIHLFVGYLWNNKKNLLLKQHSGKDVKLQLDKTVSLNSVTTKNLLFEGFGNFPWLTLLKFDKADIIQIDDSLIIFGKGNISMLGKGINRPFEINFNNKFITTFNKAYYLDHRNSGENLTLRLTGNSVGRTIEFTITIKNWKI